MSQHVVSLFVLRLEIVVRVHKTPRACFLFPSPLPPTLSFFDGAELGRCNGSTKVSWASYLLSGVSAAGDDGDSADLEELHLVRRCVVCWLVKLRGVDKTVVWRLWTDFLISSTSECA